MTPGKPKGGGEHTPTPWKVWQDEREDIDVPDYWRTAITFDAPGGKILARINGMAGTKEPPANAAFIVRAVNAYQAIKDALGTDEDGDALVSVARNAHRAEQELAFILSERSKE